MRSIVRFVPGKGRDTTPNAGDLIYRFPKLAGVGEA